MKLNKLFFVALAAVFAFASCAKDGNTPEPGVNHNAPITSVALKLDLVKPVQGAPATYTTEAGTVVESNLVKVDIYVFAGQELEKIILGATMTGINTQKFQVTVGPKRVYVLANAPTSINLTGVVAADAASSTTGTLVPVFEKLLQKITIADATHATNGFLMTNIKTPLAITLQPNVKDPLGESKNVLTIEIGRITAKVRPMFTATAATSPLGELSSVNYKLGIIAEQTYLIGQFNTIGDIITPYYDELVGQTPPTVTPPTSLADILYSDYAEGETTYRAMDLSDLPASTVVSYAFENSNKVAKTGNTTRVVIKGVFTPKAMIDGDGAPTTAITTGTTFYALYSDTGLEGFCATDGAGGTIAAKPGFKSVEYTNGASFYHVQLTGANKAVAAIPYTVVRNSLFKVNVTGVTGPGMNSELGLIEDGTDPIDADTELVVSIDVLGWSIVDQNVIIG